jgi:phosphoribosylanthranilate isomerase
LSENDPVEWMVKSFHDTTDMYMFDTLGAGYGGTGKKFDWNQLKTARIDKLFFLSGGIEPDDAKGLNEFFKEPVAKKLFSIDINSKFEITAGVKDIERIRKFVKELKGV